MKDLIKKNYRYIENFSTNNESVYPKDHLGSFFRLSNISKSALESFLLKMKGKDQSFPSEYSKEMHRAIATESYKREWSDSKTTSLYDKDLTEMTNAYGAGNQAILEQVSSVLKSREFVDLSITDIGVGTGGTILPIIYYIESNYLNKYITINLCDIDLQKSTLVQDYILNSFTKNQYKIRSIKLELDNISEEFKQLTPVDFIVSGATLCHSIDKNLMIQELAKHLNRSGYFITWDANLPFKFPLVIAKDENYRRYSYFLAYVYPVQLGLREGAKVRDMENVNIVISQEFQSNMCKHAFEYCIKSFKIQKLLDFKIYIEWLYENYFKYYKIMQSETSKYKLYEAFEDYREIEKHLSSNHLEILNSQWLDSNDQTLLIEKDAAMKSCRFIVAKKI
jgi:SAM-dependent methyltransferase